MKKLMRKALNKQAAPTPDTGGRITNETVAEHREKVLAGGRKFKYPLQYTKHRVLFITIIIVVVTTLSFLGLCGWQLYGAQSSDKFIYSLTQIVPVPVAQVKGQWVRYSDYLLVLRSAIHYLSTKEAVNFNSDDGRRQLDYQKRLAMDKAIVNTYVTQLAAENNISVSQKEVDDFVKQQISANRLGVSENVYRQVIRDYYDWSFDEYKNSIRQQLLRKKVLAKLDTVARENITKLLQAARAQGADFAALAKAYSEDIATKASGGDVGMVNSDTEDSNGLIAAANSLQPGQVSDVIEGVDGFYIVRLTEKQGDTLRFSKIFASYRFIDLKLAELRGKGEVKEFITVKEIAQPTNQ